MRLFLFVLICMAVPLRAQAALSDITVIFQQTPTLDAFSVCYGGGCAETQKLALDADDWQRIAAIFSKSKIENVEAATEQERENIAEAIGVFESIVGLKTGTDTDRAGTFDNSKFAGQLDCNDEAINTTTYLRLMVSNGLIQFHAVEDMRTRNFFFTGWPHSTAVMHEVASHQRYAVDSWFYDNGLPATIVPFEVWKSGYIPADSPISTARDAD